MKSVARVLVCAVSALICGCGHGARAAMTDALSADNSAQFDGPVGAPPVEPESLRIKPTDLPPTQAPAIAPERIQPKMDETYERPEMPPRLEDPAQDAPPTTPRPGAGE